MRNGEYIEKLLKSFNDRPFKVQKIVIRYEIDLSSHLGFYPFPNVPLRTIHMPDEMIYRSFKNHKRAYWLFYNFMKGKEEWSPFFELFERWSIYMK